MVLKERISANILVKSIPKVDYEDSEFEHYCQILDRIVNPKNNESLFKKNIPLCRQNTYVHTLFKEVSKDDPKIIKNEISPDNQEAKRFDKVIGLSTTTSKDDLILIMEKELEAKEEKIKYLETQIQKKQDKYDRLSFEYDRIRNKLEMENNERS
ncbi:30959_t:CDS:2 [Gigaspora margarita]|uniref:30959_t:CDS:1 n=1 Tax=Gigaspora margarita TaxID=4874 RepID=A0ABN7UDK0_GIGMA|nr:30959_t:CDS:2 [Gigaspora margarita]